VVPTVGSPASAMVCGRQPASSAAAASTCTTRRPIDRRYPPRVGAVDAVSVLSASPSRTALFLDFDGTLAAIVPEASAARPLPGVPALLAALHQRYGRVAVVSGRPVAFLLDRLSDGLELHGLYGLEAWVDGARHDHPDAERWRAVVADAVASARRRLPAEVDVEDKGLSLTVHYRQAPGSAAAVAGWAEAEAAASGLERRSAKRSVELHPPVHVDKGTVVMERAAGMATVAYLGDDEGDLPAFAALAALAEAGAQVVRVAVDTPEVSPALLAAADVVVPGPEGAVALLTALI